MPLEARDLACGYGSTPLLRGLRLRIEAGDLVCLLGPNGVGKTTLFKTLLGLLRPLGGSVFIDDADLYRMAPAARAQRIAYVPQNTMMPFPYSAFDVALMGRSPWIPFHGAPGAEDRRLVERTFETLSIGHLRSRVFTTLSGGEKQLVLIARAIVQTPQFLVLDEPTSNLDFGNQSRVLSQIKRLCGRGLGVLMTTHHPNQAFESGGRIVLIDKGRNIHVGDAESVLTRANLKCAYGIDVAIAVHQTEGGNRSRYCIPEAPTEEAEP